MTKIANFIRGDTRNVTIQVYQEDGFTPLNLTGATVFFTVNASANPTDDSAAVIQKTITIHTAPLLGQTAFTLTSGDTNALTPATYYYDVQVKDASSNIISQKADTFTIVADITRRVI